MRDNLFDKKIDIADFRFDKEVVKVFDDMVRRSVPGYDSMIQMIGLCARIYGQDNTNYYRWHLIIKVRIISFLPSITPRK